MYRRFLSHPRQVQDLSSCRQYLIEMMQLTIDIGRIRNRAGDFGPKTFAITLAQTRNPCAKSCDRHLESRSDVSLTWRRRAAPGDEWLQLFKPLCFAFGKKCLLQALPGAFHDR